MIVEDRPTARRLPARPAPPRAFVLHATGDADLEKILKFYTSASGLCPHYVVATDGRVYRVAEEDRVAYHCKIYGAEERLYRHGYRQWCEWRWDERAGTPVHLGGEFPGYRHWRDQWCPLGVRSPLDLETGTRPNTTSVGVELQSLEAPTRDAFTDAQYIALAELLREVASRHGVPLDRRRVLTHSDCSPMRRTNAAGPWDPPRAFKFDRLWGLLR